MTNQKMNISGSGSSQISVGNVVQAGGDAVVRGEVNVTANQLREELLQELRAAVASAPDRQEVEQRVAELSEAVAMPAPDPSRIKRILAAIKEHHDWAFPAISATLRKIVPWVASII